VGNAVPLRRYITDGALSRAAPMNKNKYWRLGGLPTTSHSRKIQTEMTKKIMVAMTARAFVGDNRLLDVTSLRLA